MSLLDTYTSHVKLAVENATNHVSKITKECGALDIEGMSSSKVRHVLNNLCSLSDARYLEIGTWKGSTLLSALYNNHHVSATCIENFSDFNGPREVFQSNVKNFRNAGSIPNFEFIEKDCFSFDPSPIGKKNIYLFDGGHEIEDHIKAFTHYNSILDDVFICAIDDWNHKYNNVQIGTQRAFAQLGYKVAYDVALPAKFNGDRDLWWNGFYIAVVQK
jgi:hypothetical protein